MMNRTRKRILKALFLCAAALLSHDALFAQRTYITQGEFEELLQNADTVIYRYSTEGQKPPFRALSLENRPLSIDWDAQNYPLRTLFAVKTNLLYDAVTAPNIEIEVPIGDRYSVAAEWIFPWWLSDSKQRAFELLCGTVEGRYWFGERSTKEQLTGWAIGLYVGGGYYDLEWDGTGYQGEHLLSGGIAGSYAHSIGGNMRLEYSVGLGILTTKYRKYSAQECGTDWNLLRTRRGTSTWFGPTRCRVSLVWMLHRADKRGGER